MPFAKLDLFLQLSNRAHAILMMSYRVDCHEHVVHAKTEESNQLALMRDLEGGSLELQLLEANVYKDLTSAHSPGARCIVGAIDAFVELEKIALLKSRTTQAR